MSKVYIPRSTYSMRLMNLQTYMDNVVYQITVASIYSIRLKIPLNNYHTLYQLKPSAYLLAYRYVIP